MVNTPLVVVWPSGAWTQLQEAYLFIKKDSSQNAQKVRKKTLEATNNLAVNPEKHSLDKYKKENDGSFRAFELYRYRISYQITTSEVIIIRLRHTSMNPTKY